MTPIIDILFNLLYNNHILVEGGSIMRKVLKVVLFIAFIVVAAITCVKLADDEHIYDYLENL